MEMLNTLRILTTSLDSYSGPQYHWNLLEEEETEVGPTQEQDLPGVLIDTIVGIESELVQALFIAANVLVFIFAFCGCCAAIIVCCRSKFSRPGTKFFLISLSVSDLLLSTFSIIPSVATLLKRTWVIGKFMCNITDYMQTFAMMTNSFCLIAIAIDRYLAVVRGLKTPFLSAWWSTVFMYTAMVLVWLIPISIPIPMLLEYYLIGPFLLYEKLPNGTNVLINNSTHYVCFKKEEFFEFDKYYHIGIGILFLALIITFIFCYISILVFVKKNFQKKPGHRPVISTITSTSTPTGTETDGGSSEDTLNKTSSRGRRTMRLIMVLIALHIVCRLPVWIFLVLSTAQVIETNETTIIIYFTFHLISDLKSAINPFMYTLKNDALKTQHPGGNLGNSRGNPNRKFSCDFFRKFHHLGNCCWCWNCCKSTQYDFTRQDSPAPPVASVNTNSLNNNHGNNHHDHTPNTTEPIFKSSSFWHSNDIQNF